MTCKRCQKRTKDWHGDDPRCAFETGVYSLDNWNCATVNRIRKICYEGQELLPGVAYQYCDDQKYATLEVYMAGEVNDVLEGALCLWVTWYKSRGATGDMWLLYDGGEPTRPTEEQLNVIADYYEALSNSENA